MTFTNETAQRVDVTITNERTQRPDSGSMDVHSDLQFGGLPKHDLFTALVKIPGQSKSTEHVHALASVIVYVIDGQLGLTVNP